MVENEWVWGVKDERDDGEEEKEGRKRNILGTTAFYASMMSQFLFIYSLHCVTVAQWEEFGLSVGGQRQCGK